MIGEDQVWITATEIGLQADQEWTFWFHIQEVLASFCLDLEPARRTKGRISIGREFHDSQGDRLWGQLPGGVQWLDGLNPLTVQV